ncbi:MAG: calcium-binding protein [Solirubrobacterales bacterium]
MRAGAAALALAAALAAPPASAHHSLMVREVRASAAEPGQGFVELQAYRQGQNAVAGFDLVVYSGPLQQVFTMTSDVPNSASQATILLGGSGLAGTADFTYPALGTMLTPAGGAVCLSEASPPDCVAWGSFSGPLPFPGAGPPTPAIPEGLSLTRTTARGCALGLDGSDDSDDSAADFSLGSPTPRPNSAPPAGLDCVPCGGRDATLIGTEGMDSLRGTRGRDVTAGLAGADKITGLGGDDVLCGGIGKDVLRGAAGRDRLIGGRGRDVCSGGKGSDSGRSCEAGRL